jgi:hypothetical protein
VALQFSIGFLASLWSPKKPMFSQYSLRENQKIILLLFAGGRKCVKEMILQEILGVVLEKSKFCFRLFSAITDRE